MSDINAKSITKAGFEFEQLDPNIFLIKNFLTQEENDFYYNLAESLDQEAWLHHYMQGLTSRAEAKYGRKFDGIKDLEEAGVEITYDWADKVMAFEDHCPDIIGEHKLGKRLESLFEPDCGLSFRTFGIIQRQYEGSELKAHYDQYTDKRMIWASVAYINENYTGGEFWFKHKNISLRPPARSLLIFPATEEYFHGVKEVGPGPVRYALPSFTWDTPGVI